MEVDISKYIGIKNKTGNLTVVEAETINGKTVLGVSCDVCSKDCELFPYPFKIRTDHFNNGVLPCPCSGNYRYSETEYIILAERIAVEKGYKVQGFVGSFKNQSSKIRLVCLKDGYTWDVTIHGFLQGYGCPKCSKSFVDLPQIKKTCVNFCQDNNYRYIGFVDGYANNKSKFYYECATHGIKSIRYSNLQQGRKCKECAKLESARKITFSKEQTLDRITSVVKKLGSVSLVCIEDYQSAAKTKIYLCCEKHGMFMTTYKNFVVAESSCPCCASYGYNPDKSGSFYVVRWQHKDKKFIKFGITNREVLIRIEEQSDKTAFEYELIFSASFTDGNIPLILEKAIKACPEIIKTCISKEEFPDGFTETTMEYCLDLLEDVVINTLTTI